MIFESHKNENLAHMKSFYTLKRINASVWQKVAIGCKTNLAASFSGWFWRLAKSENKSPSLILTFLETFPILVRATRGWSIFKKIYCHVIWTLNEFLHKKNQDQDWKRLQLKQ